MTHPDTPYLDCWHSGKEYPGTGYSAKEESGRNLECKPLLCFGEHQAVPGGDGVEPIEGIAMHLTWGFQKTNGAQWMEC